MQTNYKLVTCSAVDAWPPQTYAAMRTILGPVLAAKLQQTKPPPLSKEEDQTSLIPYSEKKNAAIEIEKINKLNIRVCTLQPRRSSDLTLKKKIKKKNVCLL